MAQYSAPLNRRRSARECHRPLRRGLLNALGALALAPWPGARVAEAAGLGAISDADALSALRAALESGTNSAISRLGRAGGFLDDAKFRIPLPDALRKTEKLLRLAGKGKELDELVVAMNRAAEAAIPQAKSLALQAVRSMSVSDAKAIITGGEDSVTQFFRRNTQAGLVERFRPLVAAQVSRLGLAKQYDALAGQGSKLGLVKGNATTMDGYVTDRAVGSLYQAIAEQERAIRRDPIRTGSQILGKVFGALR